MDVRAAILAQFEQVADEQERSLGPLTDDTPLLELGLDSLCFAIIVSRLDMELGADPFTDGAGGKFPVTVGEFVSFYEHALR